jgi:translocation and assembly module TamA
MQGMRRIWPRNCSNAIGAFASAHPGVRAMLAAFLWSAVVAGTLLSSNANDSSGAAPRDSVVRRHPVAPARSAARERLLRGVAYSGWKVTAVVVTGIPRDVRAQLTEGLALTGQPHWLVLRRRALFTPKLLASDLERTRLFLPRNGYAAAEVQARFETRVQSRQLRVVFEIVPGPRSLVSRDRAETVPPELEAQALRILQLDRDEPFRDARVEERSARLLALLQEHGRAKALVTTEILRSDSTHVEVLYHVVAGEIHRFGEKRIDGSPPDLQGTVERTIDIRPGSTYSPAQLRRADEGLRSLDLFRRVEVTTADAGPGILDVVAHLAERAPRTLQAGVGYYTDDGAKASAAWKHRNLFGGGRGASLEGSASRFLQDVRGTVWKPTLFRTRTRGSIALDVQRQSEALYTMRSASLQLAALYLQSSSTTIRPSISVSRVDVRSKVPLDSVFASQPRSLLTLGVRWTRSRLDDLINPGRGTSTWASAEYGLPDLRFVHPYALTEGEVVAYRPLTEKTLVAGRLHAGIALPAADALSLLPDKRFYSGGATSMRGYGRRELGPLDTKGRPIGGAALFESSLEYRFPLVGALQGAVFFDAAQVWGRWEDYLSHLALATGPGLILRTPIGLARIDLGVLVTAPEAGQPRQVVQLQVGHGF